ncbi:MAG: hypothetical protein EOO28_27010 [Comamonadaceae bacterium]|nr:MAG: hypothetical protein EOO28_27010 [Comamonadaceae bacterium]
MVGFSSAAANTGTDDALWSASSLHEAALMTAQPPVDMAAEAGADRMVEACAMWVFMGSMACAIVSLGFLVLPLVSGY